MSVLRNWFSVLQTGYVFCFCSVMPGTLKFTQIYIRMQLDLVFNKPKQSIFGLESAKGNNSHIGTMHKLSLVFLIYYFCFLRLLKHWIFTLQKYSTNFLPHYYLSENLIKMVQNVSTAQHTQWRGLLQ